MIEQVLIAILFAILLYFIWKNIQWKKKFEERLKEERERIKRSASALSGRTLEKFLPFLKDFPYDPHDVRWIGDPIDLVIFDGSSTPDRNVKQIVFCEVKSGSGKLTEVQKRIRDLVKKGKVVWKEIRLEH